MIDEWEKFVAHCKLVNPTITIMQAMSLWDCAKRLCGFKGTPAEPAALKPWRCTTCGAFVKFVFHYPFGCGYDPKIPWHWADRHGRKTCGPCVPTSGAK